MKTSLRFRCYPTRTQEPIVLCWIGREELGGTAKVREDRHFRIFTRKVRQRVVQFASHGQQYAQFSAVDTAKMRDGQSPMLRSGSVRWKHACERCFRKLDGRQKLQLKSNAQLVWSVSELLRFNVVVRAGTHSNTSRNLMRGTKPLPWGEVAIEEGNGAYKVPVSIHRTITAGRWYVWCAFDEGSPVLTFQETACGPASFAVGQLSKRRPRLWPTQSGSVRSAVTPMKTTGSLDSANGIQHRSLKWETPTRTSCV